MGQSDLFQVDLIIEIHCVLGRVVHDLVRLAEVSRSLRPDLRHDPQLRGVPALLALEVHLSLIFSVHWRRQEICAFSEFRICDLVDATCRFNGACAPLDGHVGVHGVDGLSVRSWRS